MSIQSPPLVDLTKYIETRFFGERPHIRNRRVPIATIAYNARTNQWDVARLAYEFTLSEAEVAAALLYYEEHKVAIDAQEEEERRLGQEMMRQYGSR
jgi:uncharacterized protein (DUF433 family)